MKSPYNISGVLLGLVLVGMACSSSQLGMASPTSEPTISAPTQPAPTETRIPTDTPLPTNTPKPTPDKKATQSALATEVAQNALDQVNSDLEKIGLSVGKGSIGWVQDEPYTIEMTTFGDSFYSEFAEDLVVSDFIIKSEITWESDGLVYCGIQFRSEANYVEGSHYRFQTMRFSGLPAWDIELWDKGDFQKNITGKVRFSDALNIENGSTNTYIVSVEGNEFTVYINDVRQGTFYDYSNSTDSGRFAWLAFQESGPSSCSFDNSWIWVKE